jgi:hypothetical protein
MCARLPGTICQVLVGDTTTIGHTLNISTAVSGVLVDSGGATFTAGSTKAVALQAVTYSSAPLLCWAELV